jgi:hypothetical protein
MIKTSLADHAHGNPAPLACYVALSSSDDVHLSRPDEQMVAELCSIDHRSHLYA